MAFVLGYGMYSWNPNPNRWEAKTTLKVASIYDCHAQLLGTAPTDHCCLCFSELMFQSFWGHHWTEAWQSVGAARASQFCEVSVVLASAAEELCWSLEELGTFMWPLYKPGDFAQRGRFDVKLAELFPSAVRTTGCLSGTAGAYTAFCSDRWSPHWLRCSARTRGCWSSPSSEITKTGLFLSVSTIRSFVFEPLTKLIFSGLELSRGFLGLWLLTGDAAPRCLEGSEDFTCLLSGELAKNPK